jgi:hypothetical protein
MNTKPFWAVTLVGAITVGCVYYSGKEVVFDQPHTHTEFPQQGPVLRANASNVSTSTASATYGMLPSRG